MRKADRRITELECVVLAQVMRLAPCTPHEVRKSFADSTAGRYSDSAGSIYPLMKRLAGDGLLSARASRRGRQRRTLFTVTAAGVREIRGWLFAMDVKKLFPDDPLRTRFQYIDVLDAREQRQWLADAQSMLARQAAAVREEYADTPADDAINTLVLKSVLDVIDRRAAIMVEADRLRRQRGRLTLGPTTAKAKRTYRPIAGKPRSSGK